MDKKTLVAPDSTEYNELKGMLTIRFYMRWIYFKVIYGFCLRFLRRCRIIDKMFFDPHNDYDMGYFVCERMMRDLYKIQKRQLKFKKLLNGEKGDCA